MKTCATCICWRKIGTSPVARRIMYDTGAVVIPPGDEGECRRSGPVADFKWPLTSAGSWCFEHKTHVPPPDDALATLERRMIAEQVAGRDQLPTDEAQAPYGEDGHVSATFRPELIGPETRAKLDAARARAREHDTFGAGAPGGASPVVTEPGAASPSAKATDDTGNRRPERVRTRRG